MLNGEIDIFEQLWYLNFWKYVKLNIFENWAWLQLIAYLLLSRYRKCDSMDLWKIRREQYSIIACEKLDIAYSLQLTFARATPFLPLTLSFSLFFIISSVSSERVLFSRVEPRRGEMQKVCNICLVTLHDIKTQLTNEAFDLEFGFLNESKWNLPNRYSLFRIC